MPVITHLEDAELDLQVRIMIMLWSRLQAHLYVFYCDSITDCVVMCTLAMHGSGLYQRLVQSITYTFTQDSSITYRSVTP